MSSADELRPAGDTWVKHEAREEAKSRLSFYYSDSLSSLPVRAVTKPGDNKADPNLETGTYGLFTTCGKGGRSAIERHKRPYLFFYTRREEGRVLAGYYRIGWCAKHQGAKRDFALAADQVHFVETPIPLAEINQQLETDFSETSRGVRLAEPKEARQLRDMLHEQPDTTEDYVAEIRRLERFNASHGKHRYVAHERDQPFTWADAEAILSVESSSTSAEDLSTNSPTDTWRCENCGEKHRSRRLLRQCPNCGAANSIVPIPETS